MDTFQSYFQYLPEYRVIICIECRYCVYQVHLKTHLNRKHKYLSPKTKKLIIHIGTGLPNVAGKEENIIYPPPSIAPINYLPIYYNRERYRLLDRNESDYRYIT